jgi:hypothetical protein
MAVSVRYLLDRLRHPRSRAEELARLRARFIAQPGRWAVSRRAVALADELRESRHAMTAALGEVASCSRCARGHPLPAGRWEGGHCCGGRTLDIFAPLDVAALKLSGTALRRLRPPRTDHAGCVFRGPLGCSLEPGDRPTICVRYVCLDLRQELIEMGRWKQVAPLNRRLAQLTAELGEAVGIEPTASPPPLIEPELVRVAPPRR